VEIWTRAVPQLCNIRCMEYIAIYIFRVSQNHIYTVYIRYFWQGNHQIYGHIRCIVYRCTVMANPIYNIYIYKCDCERLPHVLQGWRSGLQAQPESTVKCRYVRKGGLGVKKGKHIVPYTGEHIVPYTEPYPQMYQVVVRHSWTVGQKLHVCKQLPVCGHALFIIEKQHHTPGGRALLPDGEPTTVHGCALVCVCVCVCVCVRVCALECVIVCVRT